MAVLVEVTRGEIVESRHHGFIVAVDGTGATVAEVGDGETVMFLRSSAKPFQALPLITTGAADRFGFNNQEIAIACGSHSGEPIHVETVRGMLEKINLSKDKLKCGLHEPFDRETAREMRRRSEKPDVLQNNCSGKHTAMLALALHTNADIETYDLADNPIQQLVKSYVARFAGLDAAEIQVAVDGCGVPVFGMSLRAMATMYARLVCVPRDFADEIKRAANRIVSAMRDYPEMIGGTRDRLDTEIMRVVQVVSKVGAEGVYTAGVLPCECYPKGLGIAIKIEDGDDKRARPLAVIEVLRALSVMDESGVNSLRSQAKYEVLNNRREKVGEIATVFKL